MTNSVSRNKIATSPRGSKKGWPTVVGQVPPQAEQMLAHLEAHRGIRRTDAIREAVTLLLESHGYRPSEAA